MSNGKSLSPVVPDSVPLSASLQAAGFSEDEITQYQQFKSAGFSDDEIRGYYAQNQATPAAPETPPSPGLGDKLSQRWKNVETRFTPPADATALQKAGHYLHPGASVLNVAGQAMGAAGDVIGEIFKQGFNQVITEREQKELAHHVKTNPILGAGLNALQGGMQAWDDWSKKNPNDAADLGNLLNILMVGPVVKPIAGEAKNIVKDVAGLAADIRKPPPTPPRALGQVLQPSGEVAANPRDMAKGIKALSIIDTTGVETFDQLGGKLGEQIPKVANLVDAELSKDAARYRLEELATTTTTKGGTKVSDNYVKNSINHLRGLYNKTGDKAAAKEMAELWHKAQTEGLTKKEVNDIARKYGSEFESFNKKTGTPLTSVSSEKYELTRKGLKEVARRGLGPEAAELDSQLSALMNTKRLVDKTTEAITKLENKMEPRGLGERIGKKIGTALDVATGGVFKGLVERFIPRGVGNKQMISIDLQEKLQRNLDIVNRALKAKTPEEAKKILQGDIEALTPGPRDLKSKTGQLAQKIGERGSATEGVNPFGKAAPAQYIRDEANHRAEILKERTGQSVLKQTGDLDIPREIRDKFGTGLDQEGQDYVKWVHNSRNLSALSPNSKTGMSIDFSKSCPMREDDLGACLYCYVEHPRTQAEMGKFARVTGLAENPYRGELKYMPKSLVNELNKDGGLRMFAFGDYRAADAESVKALLADAQAKGLTIKAITKQPDFVKQFGSHPNLRINISTDALPGGMSNAPSIEEALALKGNNPTIKIRAVALNEEQAMAMVKNPQVDVVTLYHGPTNFNAAGERTDKLFNIIKQQNPKVIERHGEKAVKAELDKWQDMSAKTKVAKDFQAKNTMVNKVCCNGGHCSKDPTKCGFGVGELMGVLLPAWVGGEYLGE